MPTVVPLIICRALMGVGGAVMWQGGALS